MSREHTAQKPEELRQNETHKKLLEIYGVAENPNPGVAAKTIPQLIFREYMYEDYPTTPMSAEEGQAYFAQKTPEAVRQTTLSLRSGVEIISKYCGINVLDNPSPLQATQKYAKCIGTLRDMRDTNEGDWSRTGIATAITIAHTFGGTRNAFEDMLNRIQKGSKKTTDSPGKILFDASNATYYLNISTLNLSTARKATQTDLRKICSPDITEYLAFIDREEREAKANEVAAKIIDNAEIIDFTMLPPGTRLRDVAEKISENCTERQKPKLDLQRIADLEQLIKQYGTEHCNVVYRATNEQDTEQPIFGKQYLGLIITHPKKNGQTRQSCVAVSPLANVDAAYITRNDVSGRPWQEVFSQTKDNATNQGARAVKYTRVEGADASEIFRAKIDALLDCPPEHFPLARGYALVRRIHKDGGEKYVLRFRERERKVGAAATATTVHLSTSPTRP